MQGSWLPIEIDMCCCQEHDAVQFGQIGRLENNPRYALSDGELRNEFSLKTGSTSLRIKIVYFCNWKFKKRNSIFRHLVLFGLCLFCGRLFFFKAFMSRILQRAPTGTSPAGTQGHIGLEGKGVPGRS